MIRRGHTPMQLVLWAIAGSSLIASVWFLSFLPIPRLSTSGDGLSSILWENRLRLLTFVAPVVCGLALSSWAERRFKKGLRDGLWTEESLAPVRSFVQAPVWKWLGLPLLLIAVCAMIASPHGFGNGGLIYLLFVPQSTVTRLYRAIAPPAISRSGLLDWKSFKPLQSDHWGEPVRHGDDAPWPS